MKFTKCRKSQKTVFNYNKIKLETKKSLHILAFKGTRRYFFSKTKEAKANKGKTVNQKGSTA